MARTPLGWVVALGLAASPVSAAVPAGPGLRLADRDPVTVAGRGFDTQEAVRVRLAVQGRTWVRRAEASAAGTFRIRFSVLLDRCASFSVQAFGSSGSRARLFATAPRIACSSDE